MRYYENLWRKRRRRKARFLLCFFLLVLTGGFCYVFMVVNPIVVESTKQMIYSLSTTAVSDAVYDVLSEENFTYKDFLIVERDSSENIVFVTFDTVKLNLMARRFYQVAQEYLDKMGDGGIDVAIGAFTGLPFLVGIGPKVNLKLVSIGAMTSVFESNFVSAGVNQTNHSLFIHLYASVSLMLPAYSATIDSVTEMLVAESVISGKVPEVYLGSKTFSVN